MSDVATIVSGAPFRILERHPHCVPYEILIPPADFLKGGLSVLHIEKPCYHGMYIDDKRGWSEVPDDPFQLAERTVRDIHLANFLFDPNARPAIFVLDGRWQEKGVKETHKKLVEEELRLQREWFKVLVRRADASWAKNHSMLEISDMHRSAAFGLGLQREWIDQDPGSLVNCPACFTLVRPQAAICYACKAVVNAEAYSKVRFAGQVTA